VRWRAAADLARWVREQGQPPRLAEVPIHLLLCVGFSREPVRLGHAPSQQQKAAIVRDAAVVLANEQHYNFGFSPRAPHHSAAEAPLMINSFTEHVLCFWKCLFLRGSRITENLSTNRHMPVF